MVYATDNLWYAAAAHGAWNYMQGTIFGQNVSGNNLGGSLLKFDIVGKNQLILGGAFGPEASLVTIVILIVASIMYLYYWKKKQENGVLNI
ncbi:MAG: hypothetical protein GXZ11_05240 [Tissierellia bacterium]|nr:hypothetical protein [Tissierellia bacterium]